MTGVPIALIAAVARNRVIGRDNGLPWAMPGDLKHFRAATMGRPLLMGRRTFQSIGRPLPGRHLVVLSSDPAFAPAGVVVARTLAEALDTAGKIGRDKGAAEIMVAGGGTLYETTMARAGRLLITEVDLEPEGDTLFPVIDPLAWMETHRAEHSRGEKDDADFAVVTYERR